MVAWKEVLNDGNMLYIPTFVFKFYIGLKYLYIITMFIVHVFIIPILCLSYLLCIITQFSTSDRAFGSNEEPFEKWQADLSE